MKFVFVTLWAAFVATGLLSLSRYNRANGPLGDSQLVIPSDIAITPTPGVFNLIVSFHPHCPCSAASAEELSKVLARTGDALKVHVLLYQPADVREDWTQTSLRQTLERLPHTTLHLDTDGKQAARLGALTSGDAQLFAPDGKLLFHGGLTAARGHAGDNDGRDAIVASVLGREKSLESTPVFGCRIHSPGDTLAEGDAVQ